MAQIQWLGSRGREFFRGSKLEKWYRYLTQLRFLKCLQHKSVNRLDVQSSQLPIAFHQATNWNRRQELQFQFLLGMGDSTIYGTSPVYLDESGLFLTFDTSWRRWHSDKALSTLKSGFYKDFWHLWAWYQPTSSHLYVTKGEKLRDRMLIRPFLISWGSPMFFSCALSNKIGAYETEKTGSRKWKIQYCRGEELLQA